tara:strand:+ start:252 stop:533 length:282 start_codon:yes stop_codon:yes gene_type:complete
MIDEYKVQLDQALRNAQQGEMGRALAVSKLAQIKDSISTFETNVQKENKAVMNELGDMLKKHQPTEVSDAPIKEIEKKSKVVFGTLAQINQLE